MLKSKLAELKKDLANIGMSDKESDVLFILYKHGTMKPSDIARHANVPRSSVVLILNSLLQKGYILSVTVGKHLEYEPVRPEEIEAELLSRAEAFKTTLPKLNSIIANRLMEKKAKVELYEGESGVMRAYYKILEVNRSERVYFIEGKRSVKNKLKFKDANILKWQNDFKRSGIIMEALGDSSGIQEVKNSKSNEIFSLHKDRMIVMHDLPSGVCDFDVDIAILPGRIILFMLNEMQAVLIESESLSSALKSMFKGLTLISSKTDLNEKVNKLLV